ncbi:hypothetical protein DMB66_26915, partial [Actinoplanes sp. ATCC 53533]|uniref:helix-turn-helix domain-containing protein n=1 Tax=Actinoplanes sp. ATCC 53533 TaxID=1288362 RepID=UPI0010023C4A
MINGDAIRALRRVRGLTQQGLADKSGCSLDTVRRLEQGTRDSARMATLDAIAGALEVGSATILNEDIPIGVPAGAVCTCTCDRDQTEVEIHVNRRELLRLIGTSAAAMTAADEAPSLTVELDHRTAESPLDRDRAAALERANVKLWADFAVASPKSTIYAQVRSQIRRLTDAAVRPQHLDMRTSICTMLADAYQIAGEVMFDLNRHGDAEHCYAIAASAAQQANAADLWACAMIRHSYVSVYGGQHADAVPMLRLALRLARNGNSALSTRHWAADVLAQALAATGDAK